MHEVLVNRLGGLSLPRKSVVRLTDRPDMTLDVYRGRKTTIQPTAFSRRAVVSYWRKYVQEVLVNRLGGLSLPRKSVVSLTDRHDMTLDVYHGRKTTIQLNNNYPPTFSVNKVALFYQSCLFTCIFLVTLPKLKKVVLGLMN